MLTSKQLWRRQLSKGIDRGNERKKEYEAQLSNDENDRINGMQYISTKSESCPEVSEVQFTKRFPAVRRNSGKSYATTGGITDLHVETCDDKFSCLAEFKKVAFNGTVHVVLIPTVDEYHRAKLDNLIWWKKSDYQEFKNSAITEVKTILKYRKDITDPRLAARFLYNGHDEGDSCRPNHGDNSPGSIVNSLGMEYQRLKAIKEREKVRTNLT